MLKKLISISLVAMMLSVSAFANPGIALFDASVSAEASDDFTFKYAESKITSVTEDTTVHSADLSATKWDGSTATAIADLTTTTIDGKEYYRIYTGADLAGFGKYVQTATSDDKTPREKNAVLMNDIDLGGKNWKDHQIGNDSWNYTGHFEGNGHTIYNFYIKGGDTASVGGLFKIFGSSAGGRLSNLNFVNAKHDVQYDGGNTNKTRFAILTGLMQGGTVENVNVSGEIAAAVDGACVNTAGALVGELHRGTIKNCYSDIEIDLSDDTTTAISNQTGNAYYYGIGGLVGLWHARYDSNIENCGFGGTINAPKKARVGGIVGNITIASWKSSGTNYTCSNTFTMSNCYNTGKITAYNQVAGIIGWVNNGSYQSRTDVLTGFYNTGDIVASTATNSYAAGIANGAYAETMENVYSIGDVYVEVSGEKSFNDKCALLYTHLSSNGGDARYRIGTSAYCKDYTYVNSDGETVAKHSHAGAYTQKTWSNETALTKDQFKDGTALTTLGTNYTNLAGLNNGYPVLAWQTSAPLTKANTYYVADGSLTLALETPGFVKLEIAPLGGSATVNEKEITAAGTYIIEATDTVSVTGKALITIDLMDQENIGGVISALEATAIRAEIGETKRTIVLALFNGDTLEKVVYTADVTQAVIDLSSDNVTGKTLKAFVWENNTLAPIAGSPYSL